MNVFFAGPIEICNQQHSGLVNTLHIIIPFIAVIIVAVAVYNATKTKKSGEALGKIIIGILLAGFWLLITTFAKAGCS